MEEQTDSPQATTVSCAACGNNNPADSRFCRFCGARLGPAVSEPPVTAPIQETSPPPQPVAAPVTPPATATASATASQPVTPPPANAAAGDIDVRRARQLLDRALLLSERGEVKTAILAVRQSIALDPANPGAYSVLGLLFERLEENSLAIEAYQKTLELAPDSMVERDALERLRESVKQARSREVFHFDDQELFADTVGPQSVSATEAAAILPPAPAPPVAASAPEAAQEARPAPLVTPAAARPVNPPQPPRPVPQRSATPVLPQYQPPPLAPYVPAGRAFAFYLQSAPLMVTALVGLLFLVWARNTAAAHLGSERSGPVVTMNDRESTPPPDDNAQPVAAPATGPIPGPPVAPSGSQNPGSLVVANGAEPPKTSSSTPVSGSGATGSAATTGRGSTAAPRNSPELPNPLLPAPVPAQRTTRSPGAAPSMPAPRVDLSPARPEAPVVAVPFTNNEQPSGPATTGGGPFNPNNSPNRGFIRIAPARPSPATAPPRSSGLARDAEHAAMSDARSGQTSKGIDRVNESMQIGGATGWSYQQRAGLNLERGDYARAADDFQTAIAAYNDQIRRGERVQEARQGIKSCETGLRLAKSYLR